MRALPGFHTFLREDGLGYVLLLSGSHFRHLYPWILQGDDVREYPAISCLVSLLPEEYRTFGFDWDMTSCIRRICLVDTGYISCVSHGGFISHVKTRDLHAYHAARNLFERFRGFLELISRYSMFVVAEIFFLKNSNFWCVHVNVPWPVCAHAFPFRMLRLPRFMITFKQHFSLYIYINIQHWRCSNKSRNHCGRSCKSFVNLGFGWRKTNRTLIVIVVDNKRG